MRRLKPYMLLAELFNSKTASALSPIHQSNGIKKRSLFILVCLIAIGSINAQDLARYQQQAAEQNPGLQAKYKTFEAAMEQIPQAKSLQDPTLSFGYFIAPVETRVGPQRAKISLSQMFPWFGSLSLAGDVAALRAEAQYQQFLDARNKLQLDVAESYFPIYELEQLLKLEEENLAILESFKTIATTRFANEGSLTDVLRTDLIINESRARIDILKLKRGPITARFNQLLSQDSQTPIQVSDSLPIPSTDSILDSVYTNNPRITELNLQIQASQKQQELAQKQGLPKMGIGLDYVLIGERTDLVAGSVPPDGNGKDAFMPMITASIPIFRAKYQSSRNQAKILKESYELKKLDIINQLATEYELTQFQLDQQLQLIGLYEKQINETEQILKLTISAYTNSGKGFDEVLRLHQQLLTYKKMNATAITSYHLAIAKLNYLLAKE